MNHLNHYKSLISTRFSYGRSVKPKDGQYYERHHITPKCMGGLNNQENLIYLTAREHYVAHWLLTKIGKNSRFCEPLNNAFGTMMWGKENRKFTDRQYQRAREIPRILTEEHKNLLIEAAKKPKTEEHKQKLRESKIEWWKTFELTDEIRASYGNGFRGKHFSEEHKQKISDASIGRVFTEEHLINLKEGCKKRPPQTRKVIERQRASNIGRTCSNESRLRMSQAQKGKINTPEAIQKMSETAKNRERVTCPHCNRILDISNATRWHFDNCKEKSKE